MHTLKKLKKSLLKIKANVFLKRAPIAIKLAPNANAGLSIPLIDLNPSKKYFELIINHQGIIFQLQGYLIDHLLYRQSLFGQIPEHIRYLQTLSLF